MTENVVVRPSYDPGGKMKFQILTAHLQDVPNHILVFQLSTTENVDVGQLTNFAEKWKHIFHPHLTPRDKMKFRKLTVHLQDIPQ